MAAFSVLELAFTAGLAATLAGIGVPQTLAGLDDARTLAATRYVAARLQRTRMEAVSRNAACAVRITADATGFSIGTYRDGNRNGVLARDIASGVDAAILPPERLAEQFSGVDFGTLPGLPAVDPSSAAPGADPIRLGASNMASFTPVGTSSTGSVYILGRAGTQYVVRVFGETGKTRILKFDRRNGQWIALQDL